LWTRQEGLPDDFHLYLLLEGESKEIAKVSQKVSCSQSIAETCSFTLAMFVPLTQYLDRNPVNMYRTIHWECGIIGQLLYVQAEVQGFKSTGMGCFLDDCALDKFGLSKSMASLYHFSIGVSQSDDRYPPYDYEMPMSQLAKQELELLDKKPKRK